MGKSLPFLPSMITCIQNIKTYVKKKNMYRLNVSKIINKLEYALNLKLIMQHHETTFCRWTPTVGNEPPGTAILTIFYSNRILT